MEIMLIHTEIVKSDGAFVIAPLASEYFRNDKARAVLCLPSHRDPCRKPLIATTGRQLCILTSDVAAEAPFQFFNSVDSKQTSDDST